MSIHRKRPTRRALDALETRERLFTTALELFAEYGFNRVTVEDITLRAGVSKGAFYNHFVSKETVLLEQFQRIDDHYVEVFEEAEQDLSAREKVALFIDTMMDYVANTVGLLPIQVIYANQVSAPESTRILTNTERPAYDLLRGFAAEGKANGEFGADLDEDRYARMIMRNARAVIYDWCLANGSFDLEAEGREYFQLIDRLTPVGKKPRSRRAKPQA